MRKNEAFGMINLLSSRRRVFSAKSINELLGDPLIEEDVDDFGIILGGLSDDEKRNIFNAVRIEVAASHGLSCLPESFRESAFYSILMLRRLGVGAKIVKDLCSELAKKYGSSISDDIVDNFEALVDDKKIIPIVFLGISQKYFYNLKAIMPSEHEFIEYHINEMDCWTKVEDSIRPRLAYIPVRSMTNERSEYLSWFRDLGEIFDLDVGYISIFELIYAELVCSAMRMERGIIGPRFDQSVRDYTEDITLIKEDRRVSVIPASSYVVQRHKQIMGHTEEEIKAYDLLLPICSL